jgi:hypothetical protein
MSRKGFKTKRSLSPEIIQCRLAANCQFQDAVIFEIAAGLNRLIHFHEKTGFQ